MKCLKWCTHLTLGSVVLATLCALLFLETAWHLYYYDVVKLARGWILAAVLTGIFFLFSLVNSMQGTLYGINTDSTTAETKTSAAGLTVSMQNIIGFAFGPLLPSLAADLAASLMHEAEPGEGNRVVHSAAFSTGMAVALFASYPLLIAVHLAAVESRSGNVDHLQLSD